MAQSKRIDSKKIEKAAVLAVMNLIQPCNTIDYKFTEDDKNLLVDGTLELYSSEQLIKKNIIGEVDVQIKGTLKKLRIKSRGFAKYPVSIVDLKKYQEIFHGVLFFCVMVDSSCGYAIGKEVYYAQLLPYDINRVLSDAKPGQKTISIRFRPFPVEPREIVRFISAFNADQEKQRLSTVSGYGFIDKNHELPTNIKSFSFSTRLFPGEDVTALAGLHNGAYIYGEDDQGQSVVFGKVEDVCMFAMGHEATVESGDFSLKTLIFAGEHEDGRYFEFEGITLIVGDKKAAFNYTISGDFHRRYNTVRFAKEFIKTGTLSINSSVVLQVGMNDDNGNQLSRLEDSLRVYGPIVETLDAIGVSVEWDPSKMTEKEISDIDCMRQLLIERKPLTNQLLESPLVHFDIQGSRVYAFAKACEDSSYEFIDLQSDDLFFVFGWPSDNAVNTYTGFDPVPPIVAIGEEGYRRICNLRPNRLLTAFDRYPVTVGNQNSLNQKLLQMLSAYDSESQQPDALLECATILARKLYEFDPESDMYYLNLMQTYRRKRELNDEEMGRLRDLAIDNNTPFMKAAAYVLLGEADMAMACLRRCTENERKQITDYPIAVFFPLTQLKERR